MFYGLAENENWFKERINLFVALAPVVKITNTKSKAIRLLSKFEGVLDSQVSNFGIREIFGKGWETQLKKYEKWVPGMKDTK